MSLDYDLRKIPEDVRLVTDENGDKTMSPITNALIWATLAVGIGEITDKTVDEFASRLDLLQKIDGPWMIMWDGQTETRFPITRDDVAAHLGLSTNVFPMETRNKWVTRQITKNRGLFANAEPKG